MIVSLWFQYGMQEKVTNHLKIGNESMGDIRFWTTEKRNLPHLFYILPQAGTTGDIIKERGLLYEWVHTLLGNS